MASTSWCSCYRTTDHSFSGFISAISRVERRILRQHSIKCSTAVQLCLLISFIIIGRDCMHGRNYKEVIVKINEDWLAVIIAFGLLLLAIVGVITPAWMKF